MYVKCTKCKWESEITKKVAVSGSARKTCPKCKSPTVVTS